MLKSVDSRLKSGDSKLVAGLEEKIKQAEEVAERVWKERVSQVLALSDSSAVSAARDKYVELMGLDDKRRAGLESVLVSRATETEGILGECWDHVESKPKRLAAALGCYREVLRL